jgi:CheY-like chemotaxis protein
MTDKEHPVTTSNQILVCDDSKVSRIMSVGFLKKLWPQGLVQEASNADEVQLLLTANVPGYLILDHNMPGITGLELAQLLRPLYPDLKIALLTANIQDATQVRAASLGVAFFRKPITEAQVSAILKYFGLEVTAASVGS